VFIRGSDMEEMASAASYRGLIDYKKSGGVVDVRCDDFLSPDEQQLLQNIDEKKSNHECTRINTNIEAFYSSELVFIRGSDMKEV